MKKVRGFIFIKYFKETFLTDMCDFRKRALKNAFHGNFYEGYKYFESKIPILSSKCNVVCLQKTACSFCRNWWYHILPESSLKESHLSKTELVD